ncbi:MAG: hypothetical protein IZT58_09450 [Actinobacteria bacterium]|jgi:hypothetical protein|nr:hypothetical protein [Actinomycetota bacterium]
MSPDVDNERTALYSAELAAFDGTDLEVGLGHDFVACQIQDVVTGEWWPGPSIEVRQARVDARASSTRCALDADNGSTAMIRLAVEQTTTATAAHELAHALAGVAVGHGPVFRRAYLDVLAVITNLDSTNRRRDLHVAQLAAAFVARDLSVGDRQWAAPPLEDVGPIAL